VVLPDFTGKRDGGTIAARAAVPPPTTALRWLKNYDLRGGISAF
jgi:hypothetical protein